MTFLKVFDIQYDNTLYVVHPEWVDLALTTEQLEKINEKLQAMPDRPPHLVGISGASASEEEDADENDERKVFASVIVRTQAPSEDAAQDLPVPVLIVEKVIGRLFQDAHVEANMVFEQPWEIMNLHLAPDEPLPFNPAPEASAHPHPLT